jgi:ABC-type Na+ transport system ATPase subunit NatA
MTRAEIEEYVAKVMEVQLQKAVETFVQNNEIKLKELSLVERVVRVEEELKYLRQMFEVKFDAVEKHFEIIDKRFETVDKRFESLQREMNARFEAMDKRFTVVQWMIGILVGIPAIIIALTNIIQFIKP